MDADADAEEEDNNIVCKLPPEKLQRWDALICAAKAVLEDLAEGDEAPKAWVSERWSAPAEDVLKFYCLVHELADALFSVDADGDCQVHVRVTDWKRYDKPHWVAVPKIPLRGRGPAQFEAIFAALRVAQCNLSIAQSASERVMQLFQLDYTQYVAKLRSRLQAVGCADCKGKGLVRDERPWKERDADKTQSTLDIPSGSKFCKCQKPEAHWVGNPAPDDEEDDE